MPRPKATSWTCEKLLCVTKVNIEQVSTVFKPSQIHPSARTEAAETAVELGKWFHASFQNTVGARALVNEFKTDRSNMILLPRPCVKEAASLISHETRAHVCLVVFTGRVVRVKGSAMGRCAVGLHKKQGCN